MRQRHQSSPRHEPFALFRNHLESNVPSHAGDGSSRIRTNRGKEGALHGLHYGRSSTLATAAGVASHAEPQRRHQDGHHSWPLDFNRDRGPKLTMSSLASNDSQSMVSAAGWNALPAEYAIPSKAPSLSEAQEYCRKLARSHYENFSVATWFLPQHLRQHFCNVYAYCRISDDLGDEVGNPEASLRLLDEWENELIACYAGSPRHPVFVALAETVVKFDIPKKPFADLLTAFRQDQTTTRYATFDDLLGYCLNSANPVGRLVLYVCGYRDPERQELSDFTCTALQLANFWQDVSVDFTKGRLYLPVEDLRSYGVSESDIA